jgi:hypothetical protein
MPCIARRSDPWVLPGTVTTGSLQVQVNWADDDRLDGETRELALNGTSVREAFSYSDPANTAATATSAPAERRSRTIPSSFPRAGSTRR